MENRELSSEVNNSKTEFVKEYTLAFSELRERIDKIMISDGMLNQKGMNLVLSTVDALKDTMNPLGHSVSSKYVIDSRRAVLERITDSVQLLLSGPKKYIIADYETNQNELLLFHTKLLTSMISFHDMWLGIYNQENKRDEIKIVIIIKDIYLSIMNLFNR